jgi:tetratricopeptide (TPR) repeat protein
VNETQSDHPVVYWNNLGVQHASAGDWVAAMQAFDRALNTGNAPAETYVNLGTAQEEAGRLDAAIETFQRAVSMHPNLAAAHSCLGHALQKKGMIDQAIQAYRTCLTLQPADEEAVIELGYALRGQGRVEEAVEVYRRGIATLPNSVLVHVNLAHSLLTLGQYREGWQEFVWEGLATAPEKRVRLPLPDWDGSDLAGRTILFYTEQGFGDSIQLSRYASHAGQRGGKVVLGCFGELARLFGSLKDVWQVVPSGARLPPVDLKCSLQDAPRLFGTRVETVPAQEPYLFADPEIARRWKERIDSVGRGCKVGLVWAGSTRGPENKWRSITLNHFAPFGSVEGVQFFSLQKEEAGLQAHQPPGGMNLISWSEEFTDFADTAGFIANLDLVITVDTAIAHLAGALGKQTWVLTYQPLNWRWLAHQAESPWYPTVRLFRQPVAGDWQTPIAQAAEALRKFAAR